MTCTHVSQSKDKAPGIEESTKSIGALIDNDSVDGSWSNLDPPSLQRSIYRAKMMKNNKSTVEASDRGDRSRSAKRCPRIVSGSSGVSKRRPRAAEADAKVFYVHYALRFYVVLRLHTHARTRETRPKFCFLPRLAVNGGNGDVTHRFRARYVNHCEQSDQRLTPEKGTER